MYVPSFVCLGHSTDIHGLARRDTYDLGTQPSGEPGSSATNMQIEEVNESVAGDQATAKRPSRSSKAEGKKKQKA